MPWTTEQKIFIVEAYIFGRSLSTQLNFNSKNGSDVVNFLSTQWSTDGSTSSEPMGLCIPSIVKTLIDNHTLDDRNHQGHHTTLLLSETLLSTAQASLCVCEVRRLESTGSPCGEFWSQISTCILTGYRLNKSLHLTTWGSEWSCQWFCDKIDAVPDFLDNVWFSDEAHFLLSGHVNPKNNIFCGSTPPEHCLQRQLHSVKCTTWVAISKHGIIGPFWFKDDNERSVTIFVRRIQMCLQCRELIWSTFLSASETKSFCSTDLKLWRCLLHRLDLM